MSKIKMRCITCGKWFQSANAKEVTCPECTQKARKEKLATKNAPPITNKPAGIPARSTTNPPQPAAPKSKQTQSGTNQWLDQLEDVKIAQPDQPPVRPKYHLLLYSAIRAVDQEISVAAPTTQALLLLAKSVTVELALHVDPLLIAVATEHPYAHVHQDNAHVSRWKAGRDADHISQLILVNPEAAPLEVNPKHLGHQFRLDPNVRRFHHHRLLHQHQNRCNRLKSATWSWPNLPSSMASVHRSPRNSAFRKKLSKRLLKNYADARIFPAGGSYRRIRAVLRNSKRSKRFTNLTFLFLTSMCTKRLPKSFLLSQAPSTRLLK